MVKLQKLLIMPLIFLSLLANGCDKMAQNPPQTKEGSTNESLQKQIINLKWDLTKLKLRVDGLMSGSAEISTEDKTYGIANTSYGAFAFVCKNLTPYLDGYKAELQIGNLTSATFHGAFINVIWGQNFDKSKEISVNSKLFPGRYTNLDVVLTPAKPEEIKIISVTINLNTMSLQ
jgi:hypothetical protein